MLYGIHKAGQYCFAMKNILLFQKYNFPYKITV